MQRARLGAVKHEREIGHEPGACGENGDGAEVRLRRTVERAKENDEGGAQRHTEGKTISAAPRRVDRVSEHRHGSQGPAERGQKAGRLIPATGSAEGSPNPKNLTRLPQDGQAGIAANAAQVPFLEIARAGNTDERRQCEG